ncbi:MAG TPA: response regulator transcription factor [Streptosporangiaceae bacterium]
MRLLRAGLVALLSRPSDIEIIAQLQSSDLIEPVARVLRPDVAVVDIDMSGSPTALARLRDALPNCRIVALFDRIGHRSELRSAARLAQGLIRKTAPPDLIITALRRVAGGQRVIDPTLGYESSRMLGSPLTPREVDVLRIAAEGNSTAEIAGLLGLSPGTVRNHISSAITKTGTRNRIDAIRIADEEGWLIP